MVFPPIYHIGYPTLGHSWFGNEEAAEELAERLGIGVPFDDTTPVSPYGSMFMARPHTLRKLTRPASPTTTSPTTRATPTGR